MTTATTDAPKTETASEQSKRMRDAAWKFIYAAVHAAAKNDTPADDMQLMASLHTVGVSLQQYELAVEKLKDRLEGLRLHDKAMEARPAITEAAAVLSDARKARTELAERHKRELAEADHAVRVAYDEHSQAKFRVDDLEKQASELIGDLQDLYHRRELDLHQGLFD